MLTYGDIQTRILRLMDEVASSAVQTTTENLVKDAINASHRRLCLMRSWAFMRWPREESFTTTVGQRLVALNPNVGKLMHVWSPTMRGYVPLIPLRQWEAEGVDRSQTSDMKGAIFGGFWPVAVQPSAASVITIVSSATGDDGAAWTVALRGILSTGEIASETLTADGTTPVVGTASFTHLLNVTKIGTWAGTLTVKAGTPTLLSLAAGTYAKQYATLEFVETPANATTFTYAFTRVPMTLTQTNDIPEIPYPFSEILVYDALLDLIAYRVDVNANHVALWTMRREQLLKQLEEAQDESIVGATVRTVRDLEGSRGRSVNFL